jgi:hypothetical protein
MPEGWSAIGDKIIEGDWHGLYAIFPAQTPFYKLTATAHPAEGR